MEIIIEPLEKAFNTLKEAWVEYQKDLSNTFVRDSVIQRFEYTYEMSHKILRRFLYETENSKSEISEMSFNDIIRLGNKRKLLLNDLETWDKYRILRNLTSHNYKEFNAEHIILIIPLFIEDIEYQLLNIKGKLKQSEVLLHIDDRHLKFITTIIKSIPELEDCSIYLYGSRVKGKSVSYSNLDIALDLNGNLIPEALKAEILTAFEKSILPYKVDIVDLNTVSSTFKDKIEKDFVKIN